MHGHQIVDLPPHQLFDDLDHLAQAAAQAGQFADDQTIPRSNRLLIYRNAYPIGFASIISIANSISTPAIIPEFPFAIPIPFPSGLSTSISSQTYPLTTPAIFQGCDGLLCPRSGLNTIGPPLNPLLLCPSTHSSPCLNRPLGRPLFQAGQVKSKAVNLTVAPG